MVYDTNVEGETKPRLHRHDQPNQLPPDPAPVSVPDGKNPVSRTGQEGERVS